MYARFLKESSAILKESALEEVAEIFYKSASIWTSIANAALPDSWKVLRQIKEHIIEKNITFENEDAGSIQKLLDINKK